jgi:tryptophan-rich sensory protein
MVDCDIKKGGSKLGGFIRVLVVIIIAIVASLVSRNGLTNWYLTSQVNRPPQAPAPYLFGLIWTVIYFFFALVWYKMYRAGAGAFYDVICAVSILLNFLWVFVFFYQRNIELAKVILVLLLLLTIYQAYLTWTFGNGALTFLVLIYASWLVCATGLNFNTSLA